MSIYSLSNVLGSKYTEYFLVNLYEIVEYELIKKYSLIGNYWNSRTLNDVSDNLSTVLLKTMYFEKDDIPHVKCLDRGLIFEKFINDDFYTFELFYVRLNDNPINYTTVLETLDSILEKKINLTFSKFKITYQNCNVRSVDYRPHLNKKLLKVMVRFCVTRLYE